MQQRGPYRELTPASIIGGILAGAILNVGIAFAGMQIGFTIVGSTVGAILGFGLLRGVMRKGSILEVNPLAGLHPLRSDLVILSGLAGVSYAELIGEILASACARHGLRLPRLMQVAV